MRRSLHAGWSAAKSSLKLKFLGAGGTEVIPSLPQLLLDIVISKAVLTRSPTASSLRDEKAKKAEIIPLGTSSPALLHSKLSPSLAQFAAHLQHASEVCGEQPFRFLAGPDCAEANETSRGQDQTPVLLWIPLPSAKSELWRLSEKVLTDKFFAGLIARRENQTVLVVGRGGKRGIALRGRAKEVD